MTPSSPVTHPPPGSSATGSLVPLDLPPETADGRIRWIPPVGASPLPVGAKVIRPFEASKAGSAPRFEALYFPPETADGRIRWIRPVGAPSASPLSKVEIEGATTIAGPFPDYAPFAKAGDTAPGWEEIPPFEGRMWSWDNPAEHRDWNETERMSMYRTLWPFSWFVAFLDTAYEAEADSGEELFRNLYDRIFEAAGEEAEDIYYFDGEDGDDSNAGTSEDQAFKTLWPLRAILWEEGDRLERRVVCRLKRGCAWSLDDEAAATPGMGVQLTWSTNGVATFLAVRSAIAGFDGNTLLSCSEGRRNVTTLKSTFHGSA